MADEENILLSGYSGGGGGGSSWSFLDILSGGDSNINSLYGPYDESLRTESYNPFLNFVDVFSTSDDRPGSTNSQFETQFSGSLGSELLQQGASGDSFSDLGEPNSATQPQYLKEGDPLYLDDYGTTGDNSTVKELKDVKPEDNQGFDLAGFMRQNTTVLQMVGSVASFALKRHDEQRAARDASERDWARINDSRAHNAATLAAQIARDENTNTYNMGMLGVSQGNLELGRDKFEWEKNNPRGGGGGGGGSSTPTPQPFGQIRLRNWTLRA